MQKYAKLLVDYCVNLQAGERLYVNSTMLAEPLVKEVYRYALRKGAIVEYDMSFQGQNKIFHDEASDAAIDHTPVLQKEAMSSYDAYIFIRAPYNLMADQELNKDKTARRRAVMKPLSEKYFQRTSDGSMKRTLCQYPTAANAQMARMALEDYASFIFNACYLYDDNPQARWEEVGRKQQSIVDLLNQKSVLQYKNGKTDIRFSVEGRTWINSDGKTNMPSGEVFTAPVEDSVEGTVFFSYPSIYSGHEVSDIELTVEKGKVVKAQAKKGQEFLEKILTIDGADHFGEVAIGTNYNIQRATGNTLFDEKIGGTIHMALGQSYLQSGGKNQSAIHWDMITDMKSGGEILADGEVIYKDGYFL